MTLVAIQTGWDKEITDMSFKAIERLQAKHKRKLEKIKSIPTEGGKRCVFLENIESYPEANHKKTWIWLAKNRPYDNIVIYTCHNWATIPRRMLLLTDFFFDTVEEENRKGIRFLIFRQGDWIDHLKDKIGRQYMKTIKISWKDGKMLIRGR